MRKKVRAYSSSKKPLIDIKSKGNVVVNRDIPDISAEEYDAEITRIQESFERIRRLQYSGNIALSRAQSRKLREITSEQLAQLLEMRKKQRRENMEH